MIHNCHTCMGRPPLVMMINSDFHKGWLRDNKAHFSDGWTWAASQALCLKSSLSDRSSSMSRNVQGEAIGRWGFVSASHQKKPVCPLHCLTFPSSFFPCQLLPVHDLSGVADFEAVCTWTAEGVASQKGQYLEKADCQEFIFIFFTNNANASDWEQTGFTRICVWRLAQMSSPFSLSCMLSKPTGLPVLGRPKREMCTF